MESSGVGAPVEDIVEHVPRSAIETSGKDGVGSDLVVTHFNGRRHLPVVELREAA
jgi:hypothetical protein